MTSLKQIKYIQQGLQLEIIKPTIQITLSKAELNSLIVEALTDPDSAAAIKRILNPLLTNSFTQFPEFTQVTLGDTAEDGSTTVTLRKPKVVTVVDKPTTELKSMEPLVVETESVESVELTEDPLEE